MNDFGILFVDDEKEVLSVVDEYLGFYGYRVTVVNSGIKAMELVKEGGFDIIFTDLKMPDFDGLELLTAIKQHRSECEVVIVTGYGTVESAVEALKLGGYDYIQKPIKLERLKSLVERIIEKKKLEKENLLLRTRWKERYRFDDMIGVSVSMQNIYEMVDKISMESPTVLIQGESGTGKEVLARVIHNNSDRNDKAFIPLNCGAVVEGLLESELFGHVKGSFTGAVSDKAGLFQEAEGGTLFLDEIEKSSTSFQVKLLRVLQEKRVKPVGSSKEMDIDVRVISAMNGDPVEAIKNGDLRKDLFYRLDVVSIKLPPLRERKEDISPLISHFLNKYNKKRRKKVSNISSDAMDLMLKYDWPGNVRQLENVIERAFALGVDGIITVSDLTPEIVALQSIVNAHDNAYSLKENEISLIKSALQETGGNKSETAKLLGINAATLYRKIKRYGLDDISQSANT
jgi:DNA-binding NtrC family response regulator